MQKKTYNQIYFLAKKIPTSAKTISSDTFLQKKKHRKNQNKNNPTNEEKTYTQINFLQVNKKPYKSKNNINLFGKKKEATTINTKVRFFFLKKKKTKNLINTIKKI